MKQNENRFFDQRAEGGRVRGANMAPKLEIHHFSDFFFQLHNILFVSVNNAKIRGGYTQKSQ